MQRDATPASIWQRPGESKLAPSLSIVIPTFNRVESVCAAIESVLIQADDRCELIVVDDGSTDGTKERVQSRFSTRIRVIRQQNNLGPGTARNRGARESESDFIAFLDSDDLWFPWTLATVRRVLERFGPVSLMTSMPLEFTDPAELDAVVEEQPRFEQYIDFFAATDQFRFVGSGAMIVSRDAFLESGGFTTDVRVAEDLDLVLRLGAKPGYLYVASPPLIGYRRHGESLVANINQVLDGVEYLVSQEKAGRYPGGLDRRGHRHVALTRFARSASIAGLRGGEVRRAVDLYRRTMLWNLALGRAKYLLGFPVLAAAALGRSAHAP